MKFRMVFQPGSNNFETLWLLIRSSPRPIKRIFSVLYQCLDSTLHQVITCTSDNFTTASKVYFPKSWWLISGYSYEVEIPHWDERQFNQEGITKGLKNPGFQNPVWVLAYSVEQFFKFCEYPNNCTSHFFVFVTVCGGKGHPTLSLYKSMTNKTST